VTDDTIDRKLRYIEDTVAAEKEQAAREAAERRGRIAAEQEAQTSAFNEAKRLRLAELEKHRCPRCLGFIPNNDTPGAYIGALSRTTRGQHDEPIYVCSQCGTDEAMLQFATGRTSTPDEWPVARQFELPTGEEIQHAMEAAERQHAIDTIKRDMEDE
jgi:rubrerythrin